MPKQVVYAEAYSSNPSSLIELWQLDGTAIGLNGVYYFCNATNTNFQSIVYGGISYAAFPIMVENMDADGKGTLPRPKLTVSNINGFVSALLLENNQLTGALVKRIRVFSRFLDSSNFPTPLPSWVTPDPTAHFEPEVFYINRKVTENNQIITFELTSVLDVQNIKLPRRQIFANACKWKYRDSNTCAYSGAPVADISNRPFTGAGGYGYTLTDQGEFNIATTYNEGDYVYIYSSLPQFKNIKIYYVCSTNSTLGILPQSNPTKWIPDSCSKTMAGCKLRFTNVPLRTSAFPGVARSPFIDRA
jgi:lambda family phage minor tail protein L